MLLYVDTTDLTRTTFALIGKTSAVRPISKSIAIAHHESSRTLSHLETFLSKNQVTKKPQLRAIVFCSGPGSFTGIRVAASVCQALGFAWDIPVWVIEKNKVPKDLSRLARFSFSKKISIDYGKPAT